MKNRIDTDSLAEIEFQLRWEKNGIAYTDTALKMINMWRDFLPQPVSTELMGAAPGDRKTFRFLPGEVLPAYTPRLQQEIKRRQFNENLAEPRYGRFYPQGILRDIPDIFPQNVQPVRCVSVDPESVGVDRNHPLADREIELTAVVHRVFQKPYDRGGESRDMMTQLTAGPGMQARYNGQPTDFLSPDALARQDPRRDTDFYQNPRLVNHIDDRAIATISDLYERFLTPEMKVLDLMSSWRSHIPEAATPRSLVGLGMNAEELRNNPQLTGNLVHDLNLDPALPFTDNTFDAVICTASVEYLIQPLAMFNEIARVLKPGGPLIHTFSNRWFPPKAIKLWTELHEFERLGLVLDYFQRSGSYTDLAAFSARGWDRPESDKYYPEQPQSDPVYAAWGRKAA